MSSIPRTVIIDGEEHVVTQNRARQLIANGEAVAAPVDSAPAEETEEKAPKKAPAKKAAAAKK